jgi:hypothetical protein
MPLRGKFSPTTRRLGGGEDEDDKSVTAPADTGAAVIRASDSSSSTSTGDPTVGSRFSNFITPGVPLSAVPREAPGQRLHRVKTYSGAQFPAPSSRDRPESATDRCLREISPALPREVEGKTCDIIILPEVVSFSPAPLPSRQSADAPRRQVEIALTSPNPAEKETGEDTWSGSEELSTFGKSFANLIPSSMLTIESPSDSSSPARSRAKYRFAASNVQPEELRGEQAPQVLEQGNVDSEIFAFLFILIWAPVSLGETALVLEYR